MTNEFLDWVIRSGQGVSFLTPDLATRFGITYTHNGPRTRQAVQKFEQSKSIQSENGQLSENALVQLGVNANQQGHNTQQPEPQW